MKNLLFNSYLSFRKLDESLNRAWELGVLSQERLDELRKVDVRKYSLEIKDFNNEKNRMQND